MVYVSPVESTYKFEKKTWQFVQKEKFSNFHHRTELTVIINPYVIGNLNDLRAMGLEESSESKTKTSMFPLNPGLSLLP